MKFECFTPDKRQLMKVLVYVRKHNFDSEHESLDEQIEIVKRRLEDLQLTWEIVKVYRDSESHGIRSRIDEIVDELSKEQLQVDAIIASSRDRFGRYSTVLTDARVEFLTAEEDFVRVPTLMKTLSGFEI